MTVEHDKNYRNTATIRVIEVVEVTETFGRGVIECAYRTVLSYFNREGVLLARHDTMPCDCCIALPKIGEAR